MNQRCSMVKVCASKDSLQPSNPHVTMTSAFLSLKEMINAAIDKGGSTILISVDSNLFRKRVQVKLQ